MSVFGLLVAREARLLFRRPAELANPLVFFAIVVSLFPLAVGPESQLLQTLSPGLVWVAALLSVLLSLDGLFRSDFEDGSLEQWVLSPHPCLFWFWPRYWHTGPSRVWHWFCSLHCWR